MQIKLLKAVIKVAFKKLKAQEFLYSKSLDANIYITRNLWEHLLFRKRRTEYEVIERLLTLVVLESLITKGALVETRPLKKDLSDALCIIGLISAPRSFTP